MSEQTQVVTLEEARDFITLGMQNLAEWMDAHAGDEASYEAGMAILEDTHNQITAFASSVKVMFEKVVEQRDMLAGEVAEYESTIQQMVDDPHMFAVGNKSKLAQKLDGVLDEVRESVEEGMLEYWGEVADEQVVDLIQEATSASWIEASRLADAITAGDMGTLIDDKRNIELLKELAAAADTAREDSDV